MSKAARISGLALVVFAVLYLASFILASPMVGLEDGDNPASGLDFLREHSDYFFLSGTASVLAAIAFTVAVLSISDIGLRATSSLRMRVTSTFGLFTAAFLFAHGILRMQSPGTLVYMAELNPSWGESAYLAVQMAGTQGLASAGIFSLGIWAVGLSLTGWLGRTFPPALALLGILPALPWIMGLLGRWEVLPDSLWLLYIGSIILGIPLWSSALGVFLLRWKPD